MIEDGEALPTVRSIDELRKDAELVEAEDAVFVAVPMPSAKRTRIHIMVDEALLAAVEREAEAEGFTRSGYFERAARDRISRRLKNEQAVATQLADLGRVKVSDLFGKEVVNSPYGPREDNENSDRHKSHIEDAYSKFLSPHNAFVGSYREAASFLCNSCVGTVDYGISLRSWRDHVSNANGPHFLPILVLPAPPARSGSGPKARKATAGHSKSANCQEET